MKELIFLGTETTEFKGTTYNISTFIDCYNYQILRGTDLENVDELIKGQPYLCDLDIKYRSKSKSYVFYVTKVNI